MTSVVGGRWSVICVWANVMLFCLLLTAVCQLSCSIPNLERTECVDARDVVKRFYSFHFGNDMSPSTGQLKLQEGFLTPELVEQLSATPESHHDYFTASENYPKAFRVGACKDASPGHVSMQVLLFWKDDKISMQKEVQVDLLKQNEIWRINKVSSQ